MAAAGGGGDDRGVGRRGGAAGEARVKKRTRADFVIDGLSLCCLAIGVVVSAYVWNYAGPVAGACMMGSVVAFLSIGRIG